MRQESGCLYGDAETRMRTSESQNDLLTENNRNIFAHDNIYI